MTKIFIVSNPGFYNKGDAAIVLGALKTLISSVENAEISLSSRNLEFESTRCDAKLVDDTDQPSRDRKFIIRAYRFSISYIQNVSLAALYSIFGLKTIPRRVIKKEILEEYYKSELIIAALDDSFTTLYGPGPFFHNFCCIFLAKLLKKPVVLYAGSIGPFKNKFYELVGWYIINKVDLVTLREEISLEYLNKIGISKPPMHVTADLAFALQPSTPERAMEILALEGISKTDGPLVGISLSQVISKWAFPELHEAGEKYQKYIDLMAKMVDYVIREFSATIVFIPQVIGPTKENEDRDTARDIYQLTKNKDKIKLIENEYTPEELRSVTGKFDLFIGARTHAIISAALMCTPFVAIEYESHKTRGIIGKMLNCEEFVYDIRTLDLDTLTSKIDDVWLNRVEIKDELAIKIECMEERALMNGELVKKVVVH